MGKSAYKSTSRVDSILNFTKKKSEVDLETLKFPILANRKSCTPQPEEKKRKGKNKKGKKGKKGKNGKNNIEKCTTETEFKLKAHSLKKTFSALFKVTTFEGNKAYYRLFRDEDMGITEIWQGYRIESTIDEDAPSDDEQIKCAVKHINQDLRNTLLNLLATKSMECIENRRYFEFYKDCWVIIRIRYMVKIIVNLK